MTLEVTIVHEDEDGRGKSVYKTTKKTVFVSDKMEACIMQAVNANATHRVTINIKELT